MIDLTLKSTRLDLTPRRAPYWQWLEEGKAIGFRRGPDTWQARYYRDGKHHHQALGKTDKYSEALRRATIWFGQMSREGIDVHRGTVQQALMAYIEDLRKVARPEAASEALGRFQQLVWPDPLAALPLDTLKRGQIDAWRERVRQGGQKARGATTINRYFRLLAAGLSRAVKLGWVGNREAWKLEKISDERDDLGDTGYFFTRAQRDALLAAASPQARVFFRALDLTGARPGEIARAVVSDLIGGKVLVLKHQKGSKAKRRQRRVVLTVDGKALMQEQAARKGSNDLLFPDPQGQQWDRWEWARAFREAAAAVAHAGGPAIPREASTYDLRHTRISELLPKLDSVTVARYCGTSVQIIEKHYAKFIPEAVEEKLEQL